MNSIKILPLLFCLIWYVNIQAQDIEFLINRVATMPDDTIKLNALNAIVENAPDSIWPAFNQQAYELSKKLTINSNKEIRKRAFLGVADAYNNFGFDLETKGENEKAIQYWKKALKISVEYKDKKRTAIIYNNLGFVHYKMADYKNALIHFNKSISYKQSIFDSIGMANTMVNVASIYSVLGDNKKALSYYGNALKIYEIKGVQKKCGIVYNNMGRLNLKMKDYKNARIYFLAAQEIYKKENYDYGIANCNLHLGIVALEFENNPTGALGLFNQALNKFLHITNDSSRIYLTKTYLGKTYYTLNKTNEALQHIKPAIAFFVHNNECENILLAYPLMAEIYSRNNLDTTELLPYKNQYDLCVTRVKETKPADLELLTK
jgi:Tfp pilus assembly protein PilF